MPNFAEQLFANMRALYSCCDTYSDDGTETTTCTIDRDGQRWFDVSGGTFQTKFVRHQTFRFDWRCSGLMYWRSQPSSLSVISGDIKITDQATERFSAIDCAIASFRRLSVVGSLLLGTGWPIYWMKFPLHLVTQGIEKIGGVECHILEATVIGTTRRLWIGRERPLLFQFEEKIPTPSGKTDKGFTYMGPLTKTQTFEPIEGQNERQTLPTLIQADR